MKHIRVSLRDLLWFTLFISLVLQIQVQDWRQQKKLNDLRMATEAAIAKSDAVQTTHFEYMQMVQSKLETSLMRSQK